MCKYRLHLDLFECFLDSFYRAHLVMQVHQDLLVNLVLLVHVVVAWLMVDHLERKDNKSTMETNHQKTKSL